jgi:DNA-binding PadR family transcriptional regulator
MGRFGRTAAWVLVALQEGPLGVVSLLDRVRQLDGHVGPGTLYGAVVRLERSKIIEPTNDHRGGRAYRLRASRSGRLATGAE